MAQATGRSIPAPLTHTFPNGDVATLTQLSQFTLANIQVAAQRRVPRPEAPLAPGVGGELEPNPADPDYAQALQAWEGHLSMMINDLVLDIAVDVQVDDEALERLRRMLERIDAPLDEVSDKVAYIKHICLAGIPDETLLQAELIALLSLITGKAAPTEADVQAHVATFSGDVGGA